jgi:hypothetical protein
MSSGPNHRRGHGHIQDNGPTWEGQPPCSGCNSTHVARARSWWRKKGRRMERRTGSRTSKVYYETGGGRQMPEFDDEV